MNKAVLFCTCCGTLSDTLPPDVLRGALVKRGLVALPGKAADTLIECSRLCRKEEAEKALKATAEAGAQGLVVAACSLSARGREALAHLSSSSLPIEWADLREGCAWIHAASAEETLAKATDVICMGLAALEHEKKAEFVTAAKAPGQPSALVIGGGPAGLACAATLGNLGIETILVERRAELGGMLPMLGKIFPYFISGEKLLRELKQNLADSGVRLETSTTVTAARPYGSSYTVTLNTPTGERDMTVGAVVLATGGIPVSTKGHFRHGQLPGVTSQMEFEILLAKVERGEESPAVLPKQAVFLQCVAARDSGNPYCSAICCPTALKNALRLRTLVPGGTVTIAHRNIATPGIHLEKLYRNAMASGVVTRSLDPAFTPEPVGETRLKGLNIRDALDGLETTIPADALVCSTPLRPTPSTARLAQGLGLRLDDMGFVCGREPILPLAPHMAGVYICGSARWPATIEQSLEQGRAAAAKAAAFVRGGTAPHSLRIDLPWTMRELLGLSADSGSAAYVREEACSRCGRCAAVCPYGALNLPEEGPVRVTARRCGRCGSCAAVCPVGAVILPGESIGALRARIHEALGGEVI